MSDTTMTRDRLVTDPLGDGGRFYGDVPLPFPEESTITTGGDSPQIAGLIRHYERDGRKITRAFVNRIESPDGTTGWGITLYYLAATLDDHA